MRVATDGNVGPQASVGLLETPTSKAALQTMLDGKADVAVVSPTVWKPIEKRAEARGDLDTLFISPKLPAPAIVAVGKYARAGDRKKLGAAIDLICQAPGGPACSRMGILYTQAGRQQNYGPILQAYQALAPGKPGK
jgi:ABC-type phosphate/phosphonate transport system substrate-binding protein